MSRIAVVIGATSSLGTILCRELVRKGFEIVLGGRDSEELSLLCHDLQARGASNVSTFIVDLSQDNALATCEKHLADATDIFMLSGITYENSEIEHYDSLVQVNYTNPAKILQHTAQIIQGRGEGRITVISSVAGDRGRQSNYLYGSSKSALSAFSDGLRNGYADKNVHVMTVKPGFIDTPLTYGISSPLMGSREKVVADILTAHEAKKDILYTPWFWRYIMLIITHIPERIFKRLKL